MPSRAKYFSKESITKVSPKGVWKGIFEIRDNAASAIRHIIGKGKTTKLWSDPWFLHGIINQLVCLRLDWIFGEVTATSASLFGKGNGTVLIIIPRILTPSGPSFLQWSFQLMVPRIGYGLKNLQADSLVDLPGI